MEDLAEEFGVSIVLLLVGGGLFHVFISVLQVVSSF